MQYTLRGVPQTLDRALRQRARRLGKSLNEVAVAALADAMGLGAEPLRRRSLRDLAGTWKQDPEIDAALAAQRRIDDELWK